jgi:integrase
MERDMSRSVFAGFPAKKIFVFSSKVKGERLAAVPAIVLQNGMDIKTVQRMLGHKDMESTMRYLAKAQSHEVRAKVDAIWK